MHQSGFALIRGLTKLEGKFVQRTGKFATITK